MISVRFQEVGAAGMGEPDGLGTAPRKSGAFGGVSEPRLANENTSQAGTRYCKRLPDLLLVDDSVRHNQGGGRDAGVWVTQYKGNNAGPDCWGCWFTMDASIMIHELRRVRTPYTWCGYL